MADEDTERRQLAMLEELRSINVTLGMILSKLDQVVDELQQR